MFQIVDPNLGSVKEAYCARADRLKLGRRARMLSTFKYLIDIVRSHEEIAPLVKPGAAQDLIQNFRVVTDFFNTGRRLLTMQFRTWLAVNPEFYDDPQIIKVIHRYIVLTEDDGKGS